MKKPADDDSPSRRWERIEALFDAVYDLPPHERADALVRACDDPAIRAEVASLMAEEGSVPAIVDSAAVRALGLSDEPSRVGRRVGAYSLVERIGAGGMGEVYLAERVDGELEQRAAVKLLRPGIATDQLLARFRAERQILARLEHPNIARFLDAGVTDADQPYFVLEYVDGEPLDVYADKHSLTVDQRLLLFLQVCDAVSHAHARLTIHRDLKPSNILVTREGQVKLLDFGIAKLVREETDDTLTQAGGTLMSPAFASPEQVRGEPVGTATDIYSLGLVLYQLLAGRRPYTIDSRNPADVVRVVSEVEARPPSAALEATEEGDVSSGTIAEQRRVDPRRLRRQLAGDLDVIILKALRKEPDRRYGTVSEMAEDISRHLTGRPIGARSESAAYRTGRFLKRNRVGVATAAAVVAMIATVVTFYTTQLRGERDRAEAEAAKAREVAAFLRGIFEVSDPGVTRGETVTARTLLDQGATRIETRLAGEPEVQAEMSNVIGNVYLSLSLYEEAQTQIERALALRRALPEPPDSAIAATLYDLGRAQQWRGQYAAADSSYREALAIRQRIFDDDHAQVLHSMSSVAWILHVQGSYPAAESLYVHVLAGHRARPDATADDLASAAYDLGSVEHMDGRLDEAGAHFREAIAELEADTSGNELEIAGIKSDLAVLLKNQQQYDAAGPLYRDVLEMRRRYLGETHSLYAQSLNNYAIFLRTSDGTGADSVALLALEAYRQSVGEDHPEYAAALNSVAISHERRDDCAGAIPRFRQAADTYERAMSADYWVPNAIRLNLSRCLIATRQYDEAERILLTAHERLGRALGISSDQTDRARDMLVQLYEAWGRPDRAAEYRSTEEEGG
jgi:eukaryotic-like serine/threonine-protein kinase